MTVACRSCGGARLEPVLDLGAMPLANALPSSVEGPEDRFPLELAFCPACALLQITHTVPPERLFREYLYFSSYSDTMVAHARALAERMIAERGLGAGHEVLEVASNDGYLLRAYAERGVPVLGIEPAENVARVAREHGVPTLSEFFGADVAARLGRRADVLHAHNVLAHVADLDGFVGGMRDVLREGGVAVIEVPCAREMIERRAFDTIYHEHLCYFSVTSLRPLLARHGLVMRDVEQVPIHGGSLRLFVERGGIEGPGTTRLLEEERALGMAGLGYYRGFAEAVGALRAELREVVEGLRAEGKRLAGYGAAAKGTVLLSYTGVRLDYVVDRSPHKQGRFVPGVKIPIRAPSALVEDPPDVVVILAWNVADEIVAQQRAYRGRWLVPVPRVRFL